MATLPAPNRRLILGLVLLVAMPIFITLLQNRLEGSDQVRQTKRFCERVVRIDQGDYPLPKPTAPEFREALLQGMWELAPSAVRDELGLMLAQARGEPGVDNLKIENARAKVAEFLRGECGIVLL